MEAEAKILKIANMIYARDGYIGKVYLKDYFNSSHPAESSAADLAMRIYNFTTNSEFEQEELVGDE